MLHRQAKTHKGYSIETWLPLCRLYSCFRRLDLSEDFIGSKKMMAFSVNDAPLPARDASKRIGGSLALPTRAPLGPPKRREGEAPADLNP